MKEAPNPDPAPRISDTEWEIMHLVWEAGPLFAQAAVDALAPRRGWSPRTVKTLLGRLVKKGFLGFEVEGKRYRYHALVSRDLRRLALARGRPSAFNLTVNDQNDWITKKCLTN